MKHILEELYYGNVDMNTQTLDKNSSLAKAMDVLADAEDKLMTALDGTNKKMFLDYVNAWSIVNGETSIDRFLYGFKVGARITAESLCDEL